MRRLGRSSLRLQRGNAVFQRRPRLPAFAAQVEGVPEPTGDGCPKEAVAEVGQHTFVEGGGFQVGQASLGVIGGLDAHRDGLVPLLRLHEVTGEVHRGGPGKLTERLRRLIVQANALWFYQVVVDRIPGQNVPEPVGALRTGLLHELLVDESPQGGQQGGLVTVGEGEQRLIAK